MPCAGHLAACSVRDTERSKIILTFQELKCHRGDGDKVDMVSVPREYSENSNKAYSNHWWVEVKLWMRPGQVGTQFGFSISLDKE